MRSVIRNALKHKNIVLFGVTDEAVGFYKTYRQLLNIKCCVTNYGATVRLQPMQEYGVETKLYDDMEFSENDYIVLCDYACYPSMEKRLQNDGFTEYEDYVSSQVASAVLQEKRIAVLMGPCTMRQIAVGLQIQQQIKNDYFCVYYSEDELLKPYKNRMAEYKHIARMSDVYITSVCDKNMYEAKILTKGFLISDCLKIKISDYTFNGYYPQIMGDRDIYSSFFYREKERFDKPYVTLALAREDNNLRELIDCNTPVDTIVKCVGDSEFYSYEQVKNHFEQSLENVKKADEVSDIPMATYIEKMCSDKAAYCSIDEWCVHTVKYVISKIAEKMGIEAANVDERLLAQQLEGICGSELPIYPSVLKHLNINEPTNRKYRVVTYYKTRHMYFDEYIRYCAECMYQIKNMNEFLGIERL